ncbi:MAG: AI-2E family transporter [Chromatiales bacterium]|nr:AI-2E family transporter [Chromatiales bacterium]
MNLIKEWFQRYFSDPQAVVLALLLLIGFSVVVFMGEMLAPVLASLVIAFLLDGIIDAIQRYGAPRTRIVILVFLIFMTFIFFLLFGVIPLMWGQVLELIRELPNYVSRGQAALLQLPQHYPLITESQITEITGLIQKEITTLGQRILSLSLSSIPGMITVLVYLILVPLLVFFFLKDKNLIIQWITSFLPAERKLSTDVWRDVDVQLGNYVRGKFWEILIVGISTFIVFSLLGIKYAILLSVLVGLSVVVPYIGAAVVTIPVALVAWFQWGWGGDFLWLMVAYGIIQALDGNVLVPILFSEVVNLHPVAIIVAILVFGGLWGFWGVFFAIPLATLVSAILVAWPRPLREEGPLAAE